MDPFFGSKYRAGIGQTFTFSSLIDHFSVQVLNLEQQIVPILLHIQWEYADREYYFKCFIRYMGKREFSSIGNFDKVTVWDFRNKRLGLDNLKYGNQHSSANDAPVITQGAGPLTKTVAEDGLASWTPAELNATDADTAVDRLLGV